MNAYPPIRAVAALLAFGSAPIALLPVASAQGGPIPVRVAEVRSESLQDRRLVTGDVRAVRRARVASREKGLVLEVAVREGNRVDAGDLLVRLDSARIERELAILLAQVPAVEARVRERESELARAESDLEALRDLAGRDAARPKELGDATTAREAANARLQANRAEVEVLAARVADLRGRIEDTRIRAPFAGTVLARRTEVGDWMDEGSAAIDLLSTGELEVWLAVPQQHLGALRKGLGGLQVRVDGTGERLDPSRYLAIPDVDPRARTFAVVAPIERTGDAAGSVAAGMSVTAWVPVGDEAEHLTVPRDAVLRNDVGTFVYAAVGGEEGKPASASPVPVEILFEAGERAVVRSARLSAGTRVVVEGNERLYPTAPIAPAPIAPAPIPPAPASRGGVEDPGARSGQGTGPR